MDAMLREMTEQQFTEWLAFYQLEPFGLEVQDHLWAQWESIYVNGQRGRGKQKIKPEKFLLFREQPKDASGLFEGGEED